MRGTGSPRPGSPGSSDSIPPARSPSQQENDPARLHIRANASGVLYISAPVRSRAADRDVRAVLTPGGRGEADGHRGDLPRWLGDLGQGVDHRGPGPDLASYPLSQVPDEAAGLVRALLTADRNQQYLRLRMTDDQRAATPAVDFRPFIIADADTGHGGDRTCAT